MLSNKLEQEILLFNPFLLLHNYPGLLRIRSSSPPLMSPGDPESPLGAQFSAQHLLMNMLIKLGWGTSAETAADSSEGRGKHSRGTAPRSLSDVNAAHGCRNHFIRFKGLSPPTKTLTWPSSMRLFSHSDNCNNEAIKPTKASWGLCSVFDF